MSRSNRPHDVFRSIDMSGGPDACWPWKRGLSGSGRPYFTLNGKKVLAYRLTYELMTGKKLADDVLARHTCDNEVCCNGRHIIEGDHQQNMNDMKERERHGQSAHVVRAIRKLAEGGATHAKIAELYGIGRSTVTEIVGGVNYQHVKEEG